MASTSGTPLWERSKENTAPLRRGRNVALLEHALSETDETRLHKERTEARYEQLVSPSEQEGYQVGESSSAIDDPLITWLAYIKFHQESFPANTHGQFLLLERCFRALARFGRYSNDVRFIRLCCQYAEKTERPNEIFKYLYQQKIGVETAIFWIAWGFVAEKREEWKFANDIYTKGIRKRAQPLEKLNKRYREFQRRMARHWLNATQTQDEDDNDSSSNRGVLGALSEEAVQGNDRSSSQPPGPSFLSRPGTASTLQSRSNNSTGIAAVSRSTDSNGTRQGQGTFRIFEDGEQSENNPLDDSAMHDEIPYRQLEREQDRRKENSLGAEQWNGRGPYAPTYGRYRPTSKPRDVKPPPFAVYVDEECAEQHRKDAKEQNDRNDLHRRVRDDRTFREREDLYESESLLQDPLRYIRDPSQLANDQHARSRTAVTQTQTNDAGTRRKANAGFSTRLLRHVESGVEQCFEEARALAGYYKLASPSSNVNCLARSVHGDDMVLDDDSEKDDISMTDSQIPDKQNLQNNRTHQFVDLPVDRSVDYSTAQNASTASSTVEETGTVSVGRADPTINTQIAMKELSMMFSSPAVGLNDSAVLNRSGGLGPILNESGVSEPAEDTEHSALVDKMQSKEKSIPSSTFSIHVDEDGSKGRPTELSEATRNDEFSVYRDNVESSRKSDSLQTASIGIATQRHATEGTETNEQTGSTMQWSDQKSSRTSVFNERQGQKAPAFTIFQENDDGETDNGDTASLSLFDEAMRILDDSENTSEKRPGDSVNTNDIKRQRLTSSPEDFHTLEIFGDISCILPSDETTEITQARLTEALVNSVEYDNRHKQEIKNAIRILSSRSTPFPKNSRSLGKILSTENLVCDLPSHVLPQSLRLQKKSISTGTGIVLGKSSVTVKQELGRGAYGCVFLLESGTTSCGVSLAVKAQSPTGSLAWEYVVLGRLAERFKKRGSLKRYPFPQVLSFVSLADGAVLTMEAVSKSGLNFVDLVNVYRTSRGEPAVPEILAIHYVSRMLDVLESLHWFGHVLHCDTKADNWVLSSSDLIGGQAIEASNVTLADFGRSIDLESLSKHNPLECKLKGKACRDDMMCIAMRKGLPWSFDIDTYGLCDTAHVLLFGTNLEVVRDNETGRFAPKQRFRRYHQSRLWSLLFDTLLNLEEPSKTAIGSRPGSLRQIRVKFDEYLKAKEKEVEAQIKHQASFLPTKRPSISPRRRS